MEQVRDQRKFERFRVQDRTLARISSDPDRLFHIIDISSNGLAFRYLGDCELNDMPAELDIIFGDKFTLSKISVETISDCAVDYGYIPMRRRGLHFTKLTPWQEAELKLLVMKCASTERH